MSCPRWDSEPTTLCSLGRVLYPLSYQGRPAGRAQSLLYNTMQRQANPKSLYMYVGQRFAQHVVTENPFATVSVKRQSSLPGLLQVSVSAVYTKTRAWYIVSRKQAPQDVHRHVSQSLSLFLIKIRTIAGTHMVMNAENEHGSVLGLYL